MMKERRDVCNGLENEKSPYLQKHARDPIDWHPWGGEVFRKAEKEDRIVFLSIGYRSCHWCNVMHEESFSDPLVGRLLNEKLFSVKVDREERPDVDVHYMAACRRLTGGGGWPLSVFLTPGGKPFYAATYLPPRGRSGRAGLCELVTALADSWKERRSAVESLASDLAELLIREGSPSPGPVDKDLVGAARRLLAEAFDRDGGGFGGAPKFPMPHFLLFLLSRPSLDRESQEAVTMTLEAMARGAIRDQVGGGYHRYATDRAWEIPHFEKMLYDQAGMALAFLEAGRLLRRDDFVEEAAAVIDYVLADLASPEGAYYAAEDADSDGIEGAFYLWTDEELEALFGPERAAFDAHFRLVPAGKGEAGRALARVREGSPPGREAFRRRLQRARSTRCRPFRDEKVLTDWNGYFLAVLARSGAALKRGAYRKAAERGGRFLLETMRLPSGILGHAWRGGDLLRKGFLDDQAFAVLALIELYESSGNRMWLEEALALAEATQKVFGDASGAYRLAPRNDEGLLPPRLEGADGPYSSGNGVMALALARLGRLLRRPDLEARALKAVEAFGGVISARPLEHVTLLAARSLLEGGDCR